MIDELIKKYFDKNCSEEEKKRIYEYLIENPSAYAEYFSEEEWNDYVRNDQDLVKEEKEQVEVFYKKNRRSVVYKMWRYAAVVTVLIFSSLLLFKKDTSYKEQITRNITSSPELVVKINSSLVAEKIILPDSSVVTLSPHSKLTYLLDFEPLKRNISLEGSAIFKVYKNPQKPFTVFCKEVATTALGTKFKVSNSVDGKINVELLEGKIVVRRSADSNNNNERYYLLAGNAITFDRLKNKFTEIYNFFDESKQPYLVKRKSVDSAETNVKMVTRRIETPQSIQFNDEALVNVFDYMADIYGVKIIYPTKFISRIHFIGTVHKNEPIGEILRNITSMNDLVLTHDTSTNVYIIRIPEDSKKQK